LGQEETRYERNPDYIFRKIEDEVILVPIHQDAADMDCIYTLNPVGAFVWEQLDEPATESELQAVVLAEYAAEPGVVAADLDDFLRQMTEIGALRKAAGPRVKRHV
jgi:hypothetical protein